MAVLPQRDPAEVVAWLSGSLRGGLPFFLSPQALAQRYLADTSFAHNEDRIDAMIRWETSKSFAAGFAASLGGVATLPVSLPINLATDWLLQVRLAAAVALLRGYDLEDRDVQTMVLSTLLGAVAPDALRPMGVKIGQWVARKAVRRISEEGILRLNRKVGFALVATATKRGLIRVSRAVPVVGAAVGGAFDAYGCRKVALLAKDIFSPTMLALEAAPTH